MARSDGTRIDLHVKILDEAVVARAKARGLDGLVYAPHFTRFPQIKKRAQLFSDSDLLVVPAREVFTGSWRNRKHILTLGLEDPVPDFISLEGAIAEFTRQNATVLVPHPGYMTVSLSEADINAYREEIDAIETYNPKHLPWHNARANEIAERATLPVFASSYAHLRGSVGEVWTTFDDQLESARDLIQTLNTGGHRTIGRRTGLPHRLQCGTEFAHLFWENSWEKFDRVVLSGDEPTHPNNPAYEGRFDSVSVY